MKKIFTIAVIVCSVLSASAQQDPQFSMNMYNKLSVNPGYAGSNDAICGTLMYRDQWNNFPGDPKTLLFSADAAIDEIYGGVGLNVLNDQLGLQKQLAIKVAYAYRMSLGDGKLGLGADVGFVQNSLSGTFFYNQAGDPAIPFASGTPGSVAGTAPDFSFGAYYNTTDYYLGLSTTHLAASAIKYGNVTSSLAHHYYFMGGYKFPVNDNIELQPSVLVKSDGASTQLDINARAIYKNMFWGGVSYRLQDAIVAMIGLEKDGFKIGYSYDLTMSDIKSYSNGSHEIMVGYCFKPTSKPRKITTHENVRTLGGKQR
ncbi:MAG: type IX secretion system membrane protein PorP/SprF [Bacteroidota bacterium]